MYPVVYNLIIKTFFRDEILGAIALLHLCRTAFEAGIDCTYRKGGLPDYLSKNIFSENTGEMVLF